MGICTSKKVRHTFDDSQEFNLDATKSFVDGLTDEMASFSEEPENLENMAEQIFNDYRVSLMQPFDINKAPIIKEKENQRRSVTRSKLDQKRLENLASVESPNVKAFAQRVSRMVPHMHVTAQTDLGISNKEHPDRNFRRVFINGKDKEFLNDEYLQISRRMIHALEKREQYMRQSRQSFNLHIKKVLPQQLGKKNDFQLDQPNVNADLTSMSVSMKKGVIQVTSGLVGSSIGLPEIDKDQFIEDRNLLYSLMSDGKVKSYCHRRLSFLKNKFKLHLLLNETAENESIRNPTRQCRRDLYNVRKVDTHIHAAACMSKKHLLGFMLDKYNKDGKRAVLKKDGEQKTLKEVFQMLNLNPQYLNIDSLNVHAGKQAFHRFDIFNNLYNPAKAAELREIFLKTNNFIGGEYFGEMIKQVSQGLVDQKYHYVELRVSIYGNNPNELADLAKWFKHNKLESTHVRWVIQVPRIYDVFRSKNLVESFQDLLSNLFKPFFEATLCPQKYKDIADFLTNLCAFDSVDDESKPELSFFKKTTETPDAWTRTDNPSYTYWLYYLYVNIAKLNHLRRARGMNLFKLRPHCGEAGHHDHLLAAFLMAENISHGLMLKQVPVMQYLYYLAQLPVCMSPLSNNLLFLDYHKNPFPEFFAQGLNINLSTDDPLLFHYTREPLMEEYAIAAQVWNLSICDLCEVARNSVLASGFSATEKKEWLGENYLQEGSLGNNIDKTNVPDIRVIYRKETLDAELYLLLNCILMAKQRAAKGGKVAF